MARCIIITPLYAGEESAWLRKGEGDLLICADGGYRAAMSHGIVPDVTIGDFDSLGYVPQGREVIQLPVHKDDTDLAVCIGMGRQRGYREFIVAGAIGGRFDHTLAALQCAADCAKRGERVWLCDGQNRVTVLAPGDYSFRPVAGRKFSLLAYTPEVSGVTLSGTMWTLENAALRHDYPLGCSNEWVDGEARLSFSDGLLVVCISGDCC
ncbi:MAG: thiamine diphosphokinase [Clostridia bacterium]|nr:thiamine diphosphokinase [Clostridia bacterium]